MKEGKMRLGYNTNGFAHHRLVDAIDVLAGIGYQCVAITVDHGALSPFDSNLGDRIAEVCAKLDERRMSNVIETGARYILDPKQKHQPTLISPTEAERGRRLDYLKRAVDIAVQLSSECVSVWSGAAADETDSADAWRWLVSGLRQLVDYAGEREIVIAFEPEPGMFIDTMASYEQLVERMRDEPFKLTLDLGHLHCQNELPLADRIQHWADHIVNIHIEDMRIGVHEHLMFGEGEMNFDEIASALRSIDYHGPVNVELSRHSHMAPMAAAESYRFLATRFS